MIARSVHHVSFAVRDLTGARRFYEGVLGLQEIARPAMGIPGAWYRAGAVEVHLIAYPDGVDVGTPPPDIQPIANHAAFAIDDYEKVRDALRAQGVPLRETSPEIGQMWAADPDGNVIELIRPRG